MPLQMTWGISKVLYYGNKSLMPTRNYLSIHKRAWQAICNKYYRKSIYEACKKAKEEINNLSEEEKRILDKYILEGKLYGLELSESDRRSLHQCMFKINDKKDEFRQKLEAATNMFKHKITDTNKVRGMPEDFLKIIAADPKQYQAGPWIITLNPMIVSTFLGKFPLIKNSIINSKEAVKYGNLELEKENQMEDEEF